VFSIVSRVLRLICLTKRERHTVREELKKKETGREKPKKKEKRKARDSPVESNEFVPETCLRTTSHGYWIDEKFYPCSKVHVPVHPVAPLTGYEFLLYDKAREDLSFIFNNPGHIARPCPEVGAKTCHNCRKTGRMCYTYQGSYDLG
jgi:hypothetical protein